ncbi:MAG: exopolyphosphatase [Chitinophagaceae bacterium]|nr:exopolyphosphatase [Chitinophagaceae bacterium]
MNKRMAILDLGTNTFHLLIAEVTDDRIIKVLHKAEEFVQLGEDGLERIGEMPFERGLQQIIKYKTVIDHFQPQHIIAFGTAAIRSAANGDEFIKQVKLICPMEVRKISGDQEAELIYLGVKQAVKLTSAPVLIMDIGGGSTEFIIADENKIFWKQSFPVGASVLMKQFQHHEPINEAETAQLKKFLMEQLNSLFLQQQKFAITQLIGASGSFDTFAAIIGLQFSYQEKEGAKTSFNFSPEQFQALYHQLLQSNLEERLAMKGMKTFRAKMIVVAAILTDVILHQFAIQKISQSAFALKEGVLWKLIQNEKV